MPILSHLRPLFNTETSSAAIHTLRWKDRPLACPRCQSQDLKPTVGLVSRSGMIPVAPSQDTAGPMARTVADVATILTVLTGYAGYLAAKAECRRLARTEGIDKAMGEHELDAIITPTHGTPAFTIDPIVGDKKLGGCSSAVRWQVTRTSPCRPASSRETQKRGQGKLLH